LYYSAQFLRVKRGRIGNQVFNNKIVFFSVGVLIVNDGINTCGVGYVPGICCEIAKSDN